MENYHLSDVSFVVGIRRIQVCFPFTFITANIPNLNFFAGSIANTTSSSHKLFSHSKKCYDKIFSSKRYFPIQTNVTLSYFHQDCIFAFKQMLHYYISIETFFFQLNNCYIKLFSSEHYFRIRRNVTIRYFHQNVISPLKQMLH